MRAILRTLLETRRPPPPGAGPVQSYMDALIQQGQVWAGRTLPPQRPAGIWGPHPRRRGAGPEPPPPSPHWGPLSASVSPSVKRGICSACLRGGSKDVPSPERSRCPANLAPSFHPSLEPGAGGGRDGGVGPWRPAAGRVLSNPLCRGKTPTACLPRPTWWPVFSTWSWPAQRPPPPRCSGPPS